MTIPMSSTTNPIRPPSRLLDPSLPSLSPANSRRIAARWEEWIPIVRLWMLANSPSCDLTSQIRELHAEWLSLLLSQHIRMSKIRELVLDDPCLSKSQLQRRLDEYNHNRDKFNYRNRNRR